MSKTKASFWDRKSNKYDELVKKHDSIYQKTIDSTKSLLTNTDAVLDFGCASGEMSLDIAPYVKQVHGIDLSVKMIELANLKAGDRQADNVSFSHTDAFDPGLADSSFSAIIAFNIFHLLDDAHKVLTRLNGLLLPGGLLISQTPCLGEKSPIFRQLINLAQKLGWAPIIHNFKTAGLESLVASSNFEIVETKIQDKKNAVQWIVAKKI